MKRIVWLCSCCLLACVGCVVDARLGSHDEASQAPRPAQAQQRDSELSADSAPPESLVPASDTAMPDPATAHEPPATDIPDEAVPAERAADAGGETPHEPVPTGDQPAAEDAATAQPDQPHDPPATEPAPVPTCDTPTDNLCLSCDQAGCCEPRRACLELEACACRLQCRTAEHPADCAAACPAAPDRYEPWLQCLRDHCADACML